MKLSRAVVVALCLMVGMACVWAAQTAPAPTAAPAATSASSPATAAPAPAKMEFKNDQEKLSYAIGCQIGNSLKTRPTPPNLPMLFQGMTQVVNGQPTDEEKLSYSVGCQIGTSLKTQEVPVDLPMLTQAITQILNKQAPAMTDDQIREVIMAWQKDVQAKAEAKRKEQEAKLKEQGEKNLVEGPAFLAANAKKEGVKVLDNGLQYKVIKEGTGNSPGAADMVKVNYKGTLIDGTEFDSSYKRGQPAEFQIGRVIPGWTQALQLMKEGAKWELYIPANLAYGEKSQGTIPPNSVLIFEVELLQVTKMPAAATPAPGTTVITPNATAPASKPEVKPQVKPQQ
jgi:FKBP-type peptidyl-prolyl cis-trans isomerase FklB